MILKYRPDQYNHFLEDCIRYSFSEKGRKVAEHERAHLRALERLGHSPRGYLLILTNSSDPFLRAASIDLDEANIPLGDLAIAALAPKDPSLRDLQTSRKVFSREERRLIWKSQQLQ